MPSLKGCKACKKDVSQWAMKCPFCGISNPTTTTKDTVMAGIVLLVVVWFAFNLSDGSTDQSTTNASYTVISDDRNLVPIKRSIEVSLPEKITADQLQRIAEKLHEEEPNVERTFIGYRLEGAADGPYWATTHFDPNLKVRVLGDQ